MMRVKIIFILVFSSFFFSCKYPPMSRSLDAVLEYPVDQKNRTHENFGPKSQPSTVFKEKMAPDVKEKKSEPGYVEPKTSKDQQGKPISAVPGSKKKKNEVVIPQKKHDRSASILLALERPRSKPSSMVGKMIRGRGRIIFHEGFEEKSAIISSRWNLMTDQVVIDPGAHLARPAFAFDVIRLARNAKAGRA